MSEQLKAFYKAYAAWLDAGAPEGKPFHRRKGLCFSLDEWSDCNFGLSNEMMNQFYEAELHPVYPFDGGGGDKFRACENKYLNPARVAWVRKHAGEKK